MNMNYVLKVTCIKCKKIELVSVTEKQFNRHNVPEGQIGFEKIKCVGDYCEKCQCEMSKQVPTCCGGVKVKEGERCPVCGTKMD